MGKLDQNIPRTSDVVRVDYGSSNISAETRGNLEVSGVKIPKDVIETPVSISIVQRYYTPFLEKFEKVWKTWERRLTEYDLFRMEVYEINLAIVTRV